MLALAVVVTIAFNFAESSGALHAGVETLSVHKIEEDALVEQVDHSIRKELVRVLPFQLVTLRNVIVVLGLLVSPEKMMREVGECIAVAFYFSEFYGHSFLINILLFN